MIILKNMEDLITKLKECWNNYSIAPNSPITQKNLEIASKDLDNNISLQFFHNKKAALNSIINHAMKTLVKHGDLVSKNQSMMIENYFSNRLWSDIMNGVTSENGYGLSEIFVYADYRVAQDDHINSQKVIDILNQIKQEAFNSPTYSSFLISLYKNREPFLNCNLSNC